MKIPRYLRNPVTSPSASEGLVLGKMQQRWPGSNKAAAIVAMDPHLFLDLTTLDAAHRNRIVESAHPLAIYNQWAIEGESVVHPFLEIDRRTGDVLSHEGRHRAAALITAGVSRMPVAILLWPATNSDSWADVPSKWTSERFQKGQRRRRYTIDGRIDVLVDAPAKTTRL